MNTMTINRLLDRLEETLNNGKKQMFSNMRLIDANTCFALLQQIRSQLPTELAEATLVLRDCDTIKADASKEAQAIIAEAKEEALRLVAESEIMKDAQLQASELVNNAGVYADNLVEQSYYFLQWKKIISGIHCYHLTGCAYWHPVMRNIL